MQETNKSDHNKEETQFFYALGPNVILDAVEEIGVRCTGRCLALNSMENRVYEVEIEVDEDEISSPHDKFRIVKFYRPGRWTKEQILEEHKFIQDLLKSEVPVVAPLSFSDGSTLKKVADANIWYTVYPKVAGRNIDELRPEQLEQIGRLLARLHNVGMQSTADCRIKLEPETYGRQNLEYLLQNNAIPDSIKQRYQEIVKAICDISETWFKSYPIQRVHGDCHFGNVLWRDDTCFLIDFDDMVRGPCVQDLWLLTPGRDEETYRQREILLSAYEQMRDFDRSSLGLVEALRALRIIHFSAWIAKRFEDPYFKNTFVEFGTMKYWREQLIALEEQFQLMQGASS